MSNRVLLYLLLMVALSCAMASSALATTNYSATFYSVEEYLAKHPEQKALMANFSAQVHTAAISQQETQERPVRIAFVYPGKQASDYWRRSITAFKKRMDELRISYELFEYFSTPTGDFRLQEQQLREALSKDPDYLVFTLDIMKHKRLIERVLIKNRPKIILQNITTPLRDWESMQPFMYVGFDHAIGSTILARYLSQRFPNKGNYGLMYFTQGYVSAMRGDTLARYLERHSLLTKVDAFYTDGNRAKARDATMSLLATHTVDMIYACSTDVALGAIDALKTVGMKDKIVINGWGGGSAELEAIMDGDMDVTVMRINDDNGVAMAEAIHMDIAGEGDKVPTIFSGEFVLIEKGISQEELNTHKQRAFRYSGPE